MLNIQRAYGLGSVNHDLNIKKLRRINFSGSNDRVELRSLDRFFAESVIRRMIKNNPKIRTIIQKFNPELRLNMDELSELQNGHAKDTQNIAQNIVKNLPYSIQSHIDKKSLNEASYLHDLGKVLIPKEVLNKPARLNADERKIMDTHSLIGFELLKTSGLSSKTLNLIKNHHKKSTEFERILKRQPDYTLQVLTTADKYSALLENRVYKKPLSPKEALLIIYRDVENGELDRSVFMALARYVQENSQITTALDKTNPVS